MVSKYKNIFYLVILFSCISNYLSSSNTENNINQDFVDAILNKNVNEFSKILSTDKDNIKNNKQYYLDLALKNYKNINKLNISNLLKLNNISAFTKLTIGAIAISRIKDIIKDNLPNNLFSSNKNISLAINIIQSNLNKYKKSLLAYGVIGSFLMVSGIKKLLKNLQPEKYIIKTLESL